jgi:hypothetical protein
MGVGFVCFLPTCFELHARNLTNAVDVTGFKLMLFCKTVHLLFSGVLLSKPF